MPSLSEGEFVALGIVMTVLLIMGLVLQAISLLVLLKPPFRKFDLSPYFVNIALSNTLVVAVDFPPIAASAWAQKKLLGVLHCQMLGFFTGVGCITTFASMVLALIKIYRRLSETSVEFETALEEREAWKRHKIIKTLTLSWLYATAVMFPPLVGWGSFAFESGGAICAPNWRENTVSGRAYLLVLVILAFFIPLGVSILCFIRIWKRANETCTVSLVTLQEKTKARKAVMMVLAGTVSFVVSWTPYCVCALISVFGGSEMFDRENSFIPGIFAKASTVYNPLMCLLISKRFRTVALNLFGFSAKKEESTINPGDAYSVLLQHTPTEEISHERQICWYQTTPCWTNKPLVNGNPPNSRLPKETLV